MQDFRFRRLIDLIVVLFLFTMLFRIYFIIGLIMPLTLIFFFAFTSQEIETKQLEFKRSLSRNRTSEDGELIIVKITVINHGERLPIIEIEDQIPPHCTITTGSNHFLMELDKDEQVTYSYSLQAHHRGRYFIGPVQVKISDIFRFRSNSREYHVTNPITVVPSFQKLKALPVRRQKLLPEVGTTPSLIYKGRDFDFQGVREYQIGDELRIINWRTTAKYQELASNEFALDLAARIFVIFDHTTSTKRLLEEGVRAALSVSEFLISHRNKVGFYGISDIIRPISPAPGKRQLYQISEYLIDAQCNYPKYGDEVLESRLETKLLTKLPPNSQIFFVSPLYNRVLGNLLVDLIKRGHIITLIRPCLQNPNEFNYVFPKASKLANALLRLELSYLLKIISNKGINQINWYAESGPSYNKLEGSVRG